MVRYHDPTLAIGFEASYLNEADKTYSSISVPLNLWAITVFIQHRHRLKPDHGFPRYRDRLSQARYQVPHRPCPATTFHSDASQGRRRVKVASKWYRERELGRGSFGAVSLERSERGEYRAVKEISKDRSSRVKIDYRRELMAMAILAKVRDIEPLTKTVDANRITA